MRRLREEMQVSYHKILPLFSKKRLIRMEANLNQSLRSVAIKAP